MTATVHLRNPAVAGQFYPADAEQLRGEVEGFLSAAKPPENKTIWPKAIIAPHAGFVYSGPIAGAAYATLTPARGTVRRVVLLGPAHRVGFRGLALPSVDAFATPLGDVRLDRAALARISGLPGVVEMDAAHAQEHSLEVHLPFLQVVLGDFELVPIVVGDADPQSVAAVLDALWGGPETLIVISSDLSHYHDYETAQAMDRATTEAIEGGRIAEVTTHGACGGRPIKGLMSLAGRRALTFKLLDLRNSGDTAGLRDRVVGYASFSVFEAEAAVYDEEARRQMGDVARQAIGHKLDTGRDFKISLKDWPQWALVERASFVTLEKSGQLRGCIGSLRAHRPLIADVAANADASAFRDQRFKAVKDEEFAEITIKISVLSEPQEISFASEADLLAQIQPGRDGLILQDGEKRGTFLPQVWEQLPQISQFWEHLKVKAGLPKDHWSDQLRVYRYSTETFTA
jgi:AmmeMemoRadiSam system protein B/AmmeMemoRadiSam system protein A